jgi:neopullulanase
VFNTANAALTKAVAVETASRRFAALSGSCPDTASAPGSVTITLPALGFAVCAARPEQD